MNLNSDSDVIEQMKQGFTLSLQNDGWHLKTSEIFYKIPYKIVDRLIAEGRVGFRRWDSNELRPLVVYHNSSDKPTSELSSPRPPDPAIKNMLTDMIDKMTANSHKSGWEHLTPRELLTLILGEVLELHAAISNEDTAGIRDECLDIANFTAMLWKNTQNKGKS